MAVIPKNGLFACVLQGDSPIAALLVNVVHISFLDCVFVGFYFLLFSIGQMDALVLVRSTFLFCVVERNTPIAARISGCRLVSCLYADRNAGQGNSGTG